MPEVSKPAAEWSRSSDAIFRVWEDLDMGLEEARKEDES